MNIPQLKIPYPPPKIIWNEYTLLIKERKVNPNKGNILSVDHEESYEKLGSEL